MLSNRTYIGFESFFSLHNVCSMHIKQLIDLRKVNTENFKFSADL